MPPINKKLNIAIFASGAGSNAQKIIDYFRNNENVNVSIIVCNNPQAGVLNIAKNENIESLLADKKYLKTDDFINFLAEKDIKWLVLAGFLLKIPENIVKNYSGKIINIHPALLPKFGGKGMYGQFVHEAVIAAGEKESGITIHFVDEEYDHGDTIFQASCPINENDSPETLAQKIHLLEHKYFPAIIESVILGAEKRD